MPELTLTRHLICNAAASPFVDMSEEELDAVDVDALASRILRLSNELDQVTIGREMSEANVALLPLHCCCLAYSLALPRTAVASR
jgi:hypothetical protein